MGIINNPWTAVAEVLSRSHSLTGVSLSVTPHRPSRTIRVRGLKKNTSTDLLEMYFESKKAGGNEVEKVVLNDGKGEALVTFKDESGKLNFMPVPLFWKDYFPFHHPVSVLKIEEVVGWYITKQLSVKSQEFTCSLDGTEWYHEKYFWKNFSQTQDSKAFHHVCTWSYHYLDGTESFV